METFKHIHCSVIFVRRFYNNGGLQYPGVPRVSMQLVSNCSLID